MRNWIIKFPPVKSGAGSPFEATLCTQILFFDFFVLTPLTPSLLRKEGEVSFESFLSTVLNLEMSRFFEGLPSYL
jgi:hypothetical protein